MPARQVAEDFVTGANGLMRFKWRRSLKQVNISEAQANLFGVSFYPQVIVIEKLLRARNVLRPTVASGTLKRTHHF